MTLRVHRLRHCLCCWLAAGCFTLLHGQIPVGAWRDHLSWNTARAVAVAGDRIYGSNGVGLCIYDESTRNIEKLTKVNGLNDAGISALAYSPAVKAVIVGYLNGNIDVVAENAVYNIPDIKQRASYSDRRINNISTDGSIAYLSCAFGVVVIDLAARRIRDTYIIGDDGAAVAVYALTQWHGTLYAATAQGLKQADAQSRTLSNYAEWTRVTSLPYPSQPVTQVAAATQHLYVADETGSVFKYNGVSAVTISLPTYSTLHLLRVEGDVLLVSTSSGLFICNASSGLLQMSVTTCNGKGIDAYDAAIAGNITWIADGTHGLLRMTTAGELSPCVPDGPATNTLRVLRYKANRLMAIPGGMDKTGGALHREGTLSVFTAERWSSLAPEGLYDFTDVDIAPDKPDLYYVTSWSEGLYALQNGQIVEHYTATNTSLANDGGSTRCGGLLVPTSGQLWLTNGSRLAMLENGVWKLSQWQAGAPLGRLTETVNGQLWMPSLHNGITAVDKTTAMERQTSFVPYNYTATTPVDEVHRIDVTPDNIVWTATSQGPVYYNRPSAALDGIDTKGIHPNRKGTDEPGHMYALLGSENTLSVVVDGAYRKWFATERGGVFLIDENNTDEIRHFTTENSPLLSDKVYDMAINDRTGEVFFATDYGIVSYRSDAVSAGEDFGTVYAFPNPVRPDYHGEITITGLIRDADVRITDVAGNLVFVTRTMGGQAVWNGCNQRGRRVASGVYLVFCTNEDGSKTNITKILFIR